MSVMNISLYTNMDNIELVRYLNEAARKSPIIELLCARLSAVTKSNKEITVNEKLIYTARCPICMAELKIDPNDQSDDFVLTTE